MVLRRASIGLLTLLIIASVTLYPRTMRYTSTIDVGDMGRRVLVIAPHPDDEVLTAGGLIQQALAAGAQVKVLIVTAGDGYYAAARRIARPVTPAVYLRLGEERHRESLAAARALGLGAADVISLGFPDTGVAALWDADWTARSGHVGRNGATSVPYSWAYRPGAPFTGQELDSEMVRILRDFRPDTVVSPDAHESHPDHSGVASFTLLALDQVRFGGRHLTTIVHYADYPYPWSVLERGRIEPPPTLARSGNRWLSLALTREQIAAKRSALSKYRSQERIASDRFGLPEFVRRNELFDNHSAAVVAMQSSAAVPSDPTTGVVSITPRLPFGVIVDPATWISSIRMVETADRLRLVLTCAGLARKGVDYRVSLHLCDAGGRTARLDVLVHDGRAAPEEISADALLPDGVISSINGRQVTISLPLAAVSGFSNAVLSASATRRGVWAFSTASRDILLR